MLSLGASIGGQLIGSDNAFVTGAIIALSMVVIGVVALASRRVPLVVAIAVACGGDGAQLRGARRWPRHSSRSGCSWRSACSAGSATACSSRPGWGSSAAFAPEHHRAGTLSAVYLVAYLVQGATALWLGAEATRGGLESAVDVGAPAIVGLALAAMVAVVVVMRGRERRGRVAA